MNPLFLYVKDREKGTNARITTTAPMIRSERIAGRAPSTPNSKSYIRLPLSHLTNFLPLFPLYFLSMSFSFRAQYTK